MGNYRDDILSLNNADCSKLKEAEWKKYCPAYGSGYMTLSGLYCDFCKYLYDKNNKVCPNNK